MNLPLKEACPCGSRRLFGRCCGRFLRGEAVPPTAEALMRSRYSAFCTNNIDYLVQTHHPSARSPNEAHELKQSAANTRWTNLQVLKTKRGQRKDKTGTVEFVAAYRPTSLLAETFTAKSAGQAAVKSGAKHYQLHEKSDFVREGQRWYYTTGERLGPYAPKKGQPCWCGSGKKYQHCHG